AWEYEFEWIDLSGRGTLCSLTVVHAAPRVFALLAPYRACIVDLEEELRLAGALVRAGEPAIDASVQTAVLTPDDGPLLGLRR
ncbi:MAG: OB-fold domain-containing protein, partial [bacterium]|nr:OB-fold domain-containing protein [bacterium]